MKIRTKKFFVLLLTILLMWQVLPFQVMAEPPEIIVSDPVNLQGNLGNGVRGGAKAVYHTVHFKKHNGDDLETVNNVLDGTKLSEIAPEAPVREGYTFVQWSPPETYITGETASTFEFIAQYRSTNLYELNIKYEYENGSPAALSYMATYAYGETYSVDSPEIVGFEVDIANISGTAGTTQGGATELNYTVTYTASTGTPYRVEHYKQNIYDDEYTIVGTDTQTLNATTGATVTVNSKDYTGFIAQTPTQEATIAPDGSTVVKMYYDRISYILTFDTAGGTFIAPFQGRYDAAIPPVADPTRTGYTFAGWSTTIPDKLTESQTITAQWTPLTNVHYTLVYWIENADPIPGTNTYEYSYHSSANRTGTAGNIYTIAATDKIGINHFTYSHYDTGQTIAGDGSTVINIYYTRKSYTVEFNLDRSNATMTIGGVTYYYNSGPRYSFTAKYESDISNLWPTAEHIPPVPALIGRDWKFYGWRIGYAGTTWISKQTVLNDELINPNGTRTFNARWSRGVSPFYLHYMFESLDGTGSPYNGINYKEDAALSGVVNSAATSGDWIAKPIPGLTSAGVVEEPNPDPNGNYNVYFYYTRNPYTLDFYSHGQVVPGSAKTVKYGDTIEMYNFTPEIPADLPDHSFGGWYTTADCTPGTEFVWSGATMPAHNLRLFAKWSPPIYYVYFNYTKPDGTVAQLDVQQVPQGQKADRPADPAAIPGYDFDGWYYAGTSTKYSFDAQVFSTLNLTGRYLPKNDRSYTVHYLRAADDTELFDSKTVTGQTTGSTVTEQAVEVSGYLPDALSKTITLGAENNLITFYYGTLNVDYTVRYVERDTGTELLPPVTKNSVGHAVVTETAPVITNKPYQMPDNSWVIVDFTPDRPQKSLTLTSNPELNVITFYYEYVIKNHYEVRYLEIDTDPAVVLSEPKHVITAKNEVVELAKSITNYRPHSVVSTYPDLERSSSANYISTGLEVSDPVNQPPQVITFYYMPERIEITGTKTWVDAGISAPDERPQSLSLTLYANDVALSPQPVPNWTDNGNNTWTYRYINLPAAVGGITQIYTVRETVPDNYIANYTDVNLNDHGGTNIINTLDGGTTTFSGTKTWVAEPDSFGFAPRPTDLELTFYRQGINDTGWVKMNPQPEYDWNKNASEDTWTYTANGLKKYENGHLIEYKAEETVPLGYEQILDNGQDFTNEIIYTTATVTWVNGPETRPTIWLKIYQQVGENGTPEQVTYTGLKELDSSTTEVTWRGLYDKDEYGNPYIFTVREVDAEGNDWTPDNYTKVENGLNVTNTYVIPTNGKATATKTWVNGAATHPDLWLQLWRKTTTGTPLIDQPVPNRDPVKVASTGDFSHEWTGLETTDINGNAYTFYVKEGQLNGSTFTEGVPEYYQLTEGEGTLNLTNTYEIPTNGSFEATKVWVNGTEVTKPAVWFQLQRRVSGTETWEPVPNVAPLQVPAGAPYTVNWTDLEETDSAAQPYEFGVVEGTYAAGIFTPGSPDPFVLTGGEYTNEITNTYVSPKREDITVTKVFATTCPGATAPVTAVTLELLRESAAVAPHKVGEVTLDGNIDSVEFYPWKAKFTDLDAKDIYGNDYIYKVNELNVPANYEDTYDQNTFTVTNTWQTISFTAKKAWSGGYSTMDRPPVTFQLQRKVGTADPENVGAPVVLDGVIDDSSSDGSGELALWTYTWTFLPKNDSNNQPYVYSVVETPLIGYRPSGPNAGDAVPTITNTYEHVHIDAQKVIKYPDGIPTDLDGLYFEFVLQRKTENMTSWETVGEPAKLDGSADGVDEENESGERSPELNPPSNQLIWNYNWKYLPKIDADGLEYTYTVIEPTLPKGYVRDSIEGDMNNRFVVTNTFRSDIFRAFKYWDTKTGTEPVIFRLEQATVDSDNWIDMGEDYRIELNGIDDDAENYPNGHAYYEDSPWRAVWIGLPTQNNENVSFKYRVQETPPANYEIDATSSASTAITNVSLKTDITATKLWVNGETVRPDEVTLSLSRYFEGGVIKDNGYVPPQDRILTAPSGGGDDWGTHTWSGEDRFYDDQGVRKEYVYKVEASYTPLNPDTHGSFTSECEVIDGVDGTHHTITSTYTQPFIDLKAAKVWDGGDVDNRPAITIRLWRRYKVEPGQPEHEWAHANPAAPGHTLDGQKDPGINPVTRAQEYAPWKMKGLAPLRDKQGNLFEYKITETATVPGFENPTYLPDQFVFDEENGDELIHFVVTNKYKIPTTGEATATKVFDGGKNAAKPEIWFQLWRKTSDGTVDQAVPGVDPIKITEASNITAEGNYAYTFRNLETTNFDAKPYTFYVKEGNYDEVATTFTEATIFDNFTFLSGAGTLTLINKYASPTTATASATKTWVNGPSANQTDVVLTLYRKTSTGIDEEVLGPDQGTLVKGGEAPEFTYTWEGLKNTDPDGNPYTYYVREPNVTDGRITVDGSSYIVNHVDNAGNNSTAITNAYDPPADAAFTATKTWEGGPGTNKTAVALDLYRHSINVTTELVTGVTPQITGESPTYTYTWENLISRDNKGVLYTFTVKERDEDADNNVTINGSVYKVTYDTDKKNVTNTYQIPKDKNVTATKTWKNGSNVRPGIWFKLQRRTPGGIWQDVPGTNAEHVPAELSVTWTGQERTNFNGIEWEYSVIEGKLVENAFNEWTPDNFTLSGQGTLNLTNTYTIPTDTVVAKKEWENGPSTKPTVWFKLQRAIPGGEPADIPSGEAGSAILRLLPGVLSVQWENVKQTDINGKAYTFSIVEGIVNEATQEFTAGLPASYEYTPTPMTGSLGVVNTYTCPTGSKTTKKIWAGDGPQPYPEVWLRLERTISPTAQFEVVPNTLTKVNMPEDSTESDPITWNNVALKDHNGVPYVFRVMECVYDEENNTFNAGAPANYVSDAGQYDFGEGLQQITNTWQTFDLSAEIIWDGAPAEAYGLPAKTSTLSLYRWDEGGSRPDEPLGSVPLTGNDVNVPAPEFGGRVITNGWRVTVADLPKNNPVNGKPYVYSVEQTGYSAIYTATSSVQDGKDWVFTNTFDKTTVEVFKKYEQTTVRPPVTIVLFQNGVEFYRFKLDGHPDGSPDSGEPYEKEAGRLILPNLPTRTLPEPGKPSVPAVYTVTELIPDDIPFPYQRVITENATNDFLITNTYNNGRFTAIKRWNIGQAPLPESGVTFELWRWVTGSGQHYDEKMVGYNGTMDGNVDTDETVHDQDQDVRGMENREWEYTWFNLPLNGDHEGDPTKPVEYTYFVKEVPLGGDYIIDTVSSSSVMIKNVALKTDFTARKVWGGEPKPEVYLQLMCSSGSGPAYTIGEPVKLDGVAGDIAAGQPGERSAWNYTWTNLPRFPMIEEEGVEKPDINNPYTYTAKEVNSDGEDFTPDGYARYGNNSSRIINIQISDVKASKIWVGGDAQRANNIGPETYLTLYRRTVFQEEEETAVVPDADLGGQPATKPVSLVGVKNGPETVTVVWKNMPWGTSEGVQYIYSVVETDVDGNAKTVWQDADDPLLYIYNTTYDENDPLKVIDTYKSPTYEVSVTKVWLDEDESPITDNSKLPETLAIKLTGSDDSERVHNLVPNAFGNWEHTFTDLDRYNSTGKEITYTPIEIMPPGYTLQETEGDQTEGFTLTNIYTPGKVAVHVAMDWDDEDNQDGFRPDNVVIRLFADGVDTTRTIDLTKANHWTSAFTGLDQFKTSGEEIVYTIEDVTIAEYVTTVSQESDAPPVFTVKSHHEPETVDVNVNEIIWMDENDHDGIRPESVTIHLFKNDEEYASKSITVADGWTWTFADAPKREAGELITYTIKQDPVFEYTTTIEGDAVNGFKVTNAYTPILLEGDVTITWDDADDQAGLRPSSVTIKLYANGKDTDKTLTLTKSDHWIGAFTDLPKYKDGKEVIYTIKDVPVNKYDSSISGGMVKGFVIIKHHKPQSILPITGEYQNHNHSAQHGIYLMLLSLGAILIVTRKRKRDLADCSKEKKESDY
ncbi:MAG: Cna B-type domain-containing protein [Clostridiaceae bacterium]|jgi:hypothetical protein|nr:Cna B-type domain-containing protein [Clostridiaceae bacterium]